MPFGAPFPGAGLVVGTFLASGGGTGFATSGGTVSSLNFGAAVANRYLVAAVQVVNSTAGAVSVTIGGVSATEVAVFRASPSEASIWVALVPTGTSGSVVVVSSGAGTMDLGVELYSLVGNSSSTPNSTIQAISTGTITVLGGGFAIGSTVTTSGATLWSAGLTLDADVSFTTPHGGSASSATAGSYTATSNGVATAVAAWGP